MWRIRSCISKELAKDLYISLIDPYFQYCSYVYDGCQLNGKRTLQTSQNKAIRAVLKVGNRYSTNDLHTESGIEWLGVSRAKSTCIEIYKLLNNMGSETMCNAVHTVKNNRVLRSSSKVKIHKRVTKSKLGENDFVIRGPVYWDMLDSEVQTAPSVNTFKKRIKESKVFNNAHFTHYKNVAYITMPNFK